MSAYSRLAIATRGFRGGAGQTRYINQSFTLEADPDAMSASFIEESVDIASIATSTLSISIDQSSGINVSISTDPLAVDIDTSSTSISVETC